MITSERIVILLAPFVYAKKEIVPADGDLIMEFCRRAAGYGVPESAVEQLAEFYKISNGTPCFNGFRFHRCEDEILFEWWEDARELWLGQCNCDVLRWAGDKFCLGDAANISYGEEYEFSTLADLLEVAFKECGITSFTGCN